MITSQATSFLSEIASGKPVPPHKLAYFRTRTRNRLYDFVIGRFLEMEQAGLTKAELSRRIGKKPAIISRLLGAPGNWTIDTVSDLLLGIAAEELTPASSSLLNQASQNFQARDWLSARTEDSTVQQPIAAYIVKQTDKQFSDSGSVSTFVKWRRVG